MVEVGGSNPEVSGYDTMFSARLSSTTFSVSNRTSVYKNLYYIVLG